MAYIEREALKTELQKKIELSHNARRVVIEGDFITIIDDMPDADVVEVVRCKDCVYCCISTDPKTNISIQKCGYVGFNPVQSSQVSDDFYCGYGVRKDGE